MDEPLFKLKNVDFGGFIKYDDIHIPQGKTTFIIGESGCGKSTLLRLLNQSISSQKGNICYKGKNLDDFDILDYRKEISLVSQEVFLFDGSILENFKEFYKYRNITQPLKEYIKQMLSICCLDFELDKACDTNVSNSDNDSNLHIGLFDCFYFIKFRL